MAPASKPAKEDEKGRRREETLAAADQSITDSSGRGDQGGTRIEREGKAGTRTPRTV
jgi:hypothetical protein